MPITDHKPLENHHFAWGAGVLCCLLGLMEMGIWLGGYSAGMEFITALNFAGAGTALISVARLKIWPARICAAWLVTLGLLTIFEYAFEINLGLNLLIPDETQISNVHPGRPGLNTAICSVLSGIVLCFLGARLHYGWRWLLVGLACLTLMIASSVLLSHFSLFMRGERQLLTRMSMDTAVGFMVLALGMIGTMQLQVKAVRVYAPAAWQALFACLSLTLVIWYTVTGYMTEAAHARFDAAVQEMESTIEKHMKSYEQVLQGSKGLLVASDNVSRKEWQQYVVSLQLEERNPGIQGVGFAPRITADASAAHVRDVRAEGYAGYHLWPEQPAREEYFPVFYIEPFNWRNRRSFGYDMYSEPVRRATIERARDTGEPALSSKVTLTHETQGDVQAGFIMYLPVYKNGTGATDSVELRRRKLTGYVYSPFRANDLFDSIKIIHQFNIGFRIFDGQEATYPALLYNTDKNLPKTQHHYQPEFETSRQLTVAGRKWLLKFGSRPAFDSGITAHQPTLILLGGTLISFLIFIVMNSLGISRSRAFNLAYEMTRKLRDSEGRYRNLVHNSLGLICSHDESGKLIYVNPAGAAILGYSEAELLGKNMRELIPDDVKSKFDDYLVRVHEKKRDTGVMAVLTKRGKRLMWRYDNSYHKGEDGVDYVLGHAQDVTDMFHAQKELKKVNALMREMATHDGLTGLCNRALLHEHLEQGIKYATRNKQVLGILYLDLDGFKQVNDTLGHAAGDELLKSVAQALTACCRKSDVIARLGGDEFVVMLSELAASADAGIVAEKICTRIKSDVPTGDAKLKITASIGIACFPTDDATIETLIQKADAAMYVAKQSGRNAWRFYDPEKISHAEQAKNT